MSNPFAKEDQSYLRQEWHAQRVEREAAMNKKEESQLDLPEMPEPEKKTAPVVGHGDTLADPRRRHAGVERRERQKHARAERKKHGAA